MNPDLSWRACALIPVYNHGSTAFAVVSQLVAKGLEVILVDDGSDQRTKDQLAAVVGHFPQALLFTLPVNLGKGAAVSHGLLRAYAAGYTHALQVDADGQHDLGDILSFVETSRQNPPLLVAGRPVYDHTVPTSRLIGRKITNGMVALETLSRDIPDAMCGFRVYPLEPCKRLLTRTKMSRRMEFDIEILVRLHWMGVGMLFLPVRVVYPEGGISHFRMVRDNISISRIHTRLTIGMVFRLPWFAWRRMRRARVG